MCLLVPRQKKGKKIRKVRAIVYFLCKITRERTFEMESLPREVFLFYLFDLFIYLFVLCKITRERTFEMEILPREVFLFYFLLLFIYFLS
jgi:hypothetical protein